MKKPKVVIYDNDGMIVHGGRFSEKYMKEFGIDKSVMDPFFDGPFKKCLVGQADLKEELGKVLEVWQWKGTTEELMDNWFSIGTELYQNVYDSISTLKAQGAIICLATNQEKYRTKYLVQKFGYDTLFDEIFSSAQLGAQKHSPGGLEEIFRMLKEKHGIKHKNQILYWDDREDHVAQINGAGFLGQRYTDYDSFVATLTQFGYTLPNIKV